MNGTVRLLRRDVPRPILLLRMTDDRGEGKEQNQMATVQVRDIVNDVDAAIAFYCTHLGFHKDMHPAHSFATLAR
jgi:hypothetical protein